MLVLLMLSATYCFAQAPIISYAGPQVFNRDSVIIPLVPTSSGVASPGYSSTVTTVGPHFYRPWGVGVDAAGVLYVAIFGKNLVKKYPPDGSTPLTIGRGFNEPTGVAIDAAGNVYVADYANDAVKKVPAGGGPTITLGYGFNRPSGVAVDAAGNVYVADADNNAIKKIPVDGSPIVTLGSGFSGPEGVAVDALGNVYVADRFNHVVKKIRVTGGDPVVIGDDFHFPISVAVDAAGNVFVGDYYNANITKIPADGGPHIHIGSGYSDPGGVAVDPAGNVYVADAANNIVKEINPVGGYYIFPFLPRGLSFDTNTGIISGKATVSSPPTDYTITAYNANGNTTATVNIKVVSHNVNLSSLKMSNGTLAPAFAQNVNRYSANVNNSTSSVTIIPTAADANAAITVNGAAVATGTASAPVPLTVGTNTITIIITAADGTGATKKYWLTVTRAASGNASLSDLKTNHSALTPAFAASKTSYTKSVGNYTTSIILTPTTSDSTATVTINGTAVASGAPSAAIPLAVGNNNIAAVVTAQDGLTQKTYTIVITRAAGTLPIASGPAQRSLNAKDQTDGIVVHQGISPNGDGDNDALIIDGIYKYPDNKLSIMSRGGTLVYEAKGYDNQTKFFDGHSSKTGKMQQAGTYFYSLEYKVSGLTKHKTGLFVLKY